MSKENQEDHTQSQLTDGNLSGSTMKIWMRAKMEILEEMRTNQKRKKMLLEMELRKLGIQGKRPGISIGKCIHRSKLKWRTTFSKWYRDEVEKYSEGYGLKPISIFFGNTLVRTYMINDVEWETIKDYLDHEAPYIEHLRSLY